MYAVDPISPGRTTWLSSMKNTEVLLALSNSRI
jgi:hypothetical protein